MLGSSSTSNSRARNGRIDVVMAMRGHYQARAHLATLRLRVRTCPTRMRWPRSPAHSRWLAFPSSLTIARMKVLGINFSNDAAAALVVDGEVVAASQEERFTRIKHDAQFPARATRFC